MSSLGRLKRHNLNPEIPVPAAAVACDAQDSFEIADIRRSICCIYPLKSNQDAGKAYTNEAVIDRNIAWCRFERKIWCTLCTLILCKCAHLHVHLHQKAAFWLYLSCSSRQQYDQHSVVCTTAQNCFTWCIVIPLPYLQSAYGDRYISWM